MAIYSIILYVGVSILLPLFFSQPPNSPLQKSIYLFPLINLETDLFSTSNLLRPLTLFYLFCLFYIMPYINSSTSVAYLHNLDELLFNGGRLQCLLTNGLFSYFVYFLHLVNLMQGMTGSLCRLCFILDDRLSMQSLRCMSFTLETLVDICMTLRVGMDQLILKHMMGRCA